ncbi:MAG: type II toxin-antitoxin system ParD family antitoxin [Methylacidiphilales bacterium]|nr:type II toxin-antitoxin system ParD family antitoxin [Candidatus Methylacidiphilales bacterium]
MNVSLTPELEKFVEQEVDSGLYQTASEVIRAGLRRLKQDQARQLPPTPRTLGELETQLLQAVEALDAGKGVSGGKVFSRLRKRIKEIHTST